MTTATAIFIVGLIFLAVAMMMIGYWFRRPAIAIGAAVSWVGFGLYSRSLSAATWDIYYIMFIIGIIMFLVCFIEGIVLRPSKEDTEPEEDIWDRDTEESITRFKKWQERRALFGNLIKKSGRRARRQIINDPGPYDNEQ